MYSENGYFFPSACDFIEGRQEAEIIVAKKVSCPCLPSNQNRQVGLRTRCRQAGPGLPLLRQARGGGRWPRKKRFAWSEFPSFQPTAAGPQCSGPGKHDGESRAYKHGAPRASQAGPRPALQGHLQSPPTTLTAPLPQPSTSHFRIQHWVGRTLPA